MRGEGGNILTSSAARECGGVAGGGARAAGDRVRRIGVLMSYDENDPEVKHRVSAFTQALARLTAAAVRSARPPRKQVPTRALILRTEATIVDATTEIATLRQKLAALAEADQDNVFTQESGRHNATEADKDNAFMLLTSWKSDTSTASHAISDTRLKMRGCESSARPGQGACWRKR
jgi:hypothetical protein